MAELSGIHVKITGDASGLKSELQSAKTNLQSLGGIAEKTKTSLGGLRNSVSGLAATFSGAATRGIDLFRTRLAGIGQAAARNTNAIRMVSLQLSQVGQMAMVSGDVVKALAIQLPDIGLAFGTVGTAVGLLAGIGLPMLYDALVGSGDAADDTSNRVADLADAYARLGTVSQATAEQIALYTVAAFGDASYAVQQLIDDLRELELMRIKEFLAGAFDDAAPAIERYRQAMSDLRDIADAKSLTQGQKMLLENAKAVLGLTQLTGAEYIKQTETIDAMIRAYDRIAQSESKDEITKSIALAIDYAKELGGPAAQTIVDGLLAAASAAGVLEEAMAAAKDAAIEDIAGTSGGPPRRRYRRGIRRDRVPLPPPPRAPRAGRADPLPRELEKVRDSLATQAEMYAKAYDEQLETLKSALEARLITQQEFEEMSLRSAQNYSAQMAGIDKAYYGDGLQQAGAFFGDMASAFAQGNEKMLQLSKAFGAAEALVNAWRAASQAFADPRVPFLAKFAAAASVLSAGMGMVSAIKGVGKGGSGQTSLGGSTTGEQAAGGSAPQTSRNVAIHLTGGDMFSRSQVQQLINQINEAVEDGAMVRLV